jgi:predicted dienelactone hydrolase
MSHRVATAVAHVDGVAPTRLARVITNSRAGSAVAPRSGGYPVVLFSPGYGVTRAMYTTLYEDLASHGFVVAAIDHTLEAPAVEFPDGAIVRRRFPADASGVAFKAIDLRLRDTRLVLAKLPNVNTSEPLRGALDLRRIGMFGHSLGGLTAIRSLADEKTLRAGLDLAGSVFGLPWRARIHQPVMILDGSQRESTLAHLWPRLAGPRTWITIPSARHLDFSDWAVLGDSLAPNPAVRSQLGPGFMDSEIALVRSYVLTFFDRYLRNGQSKLLTNPPANVIVH